MVAAVPPIAAGVVSLLLALGVPPLRAWLWPASADNAAEAAASGDAARVRALAAHGERLDGALEAAVRRESEDSLVPVLLDVGVRPSRDEQERLYCVAKEIGADDAASLLDEAFDLSMVRCER